MTAKAKSGGERNGAGDVSKNLTDAINRLPDLKEGSNEAVLIPRIQPKIIELEVVGSTPLVVQAWPEKARKEILEAQMGKAHKKKEARDPEAEYLASRYISTEGWDGLPAGGVKGCLVNACRAVDGLPMTMAKRMVFIRAQGYTGKGQGLVRIYGTPEKHDGMCRLTNGNATPRFRAMYRQWSLKLEVEFLANVISAEQVVNLIELAGYIEGLCEHRPGSPKSHTGDWGRFAIRRSE